MNVSTFRKQVNEINLRDPAQGLYSIRVYRLTGNMIASSIFTAILSEHNRLISSPKREKEIADRDGWFYLKGEYIAQRTGVQTSNLSKYVNKLIASNLLEKKVGVNVENNGKITWYRLSGVGEGGYLSGKDMGILEAKTSRGRVRYREENKRHKENTVANFPVMDECYVSKRRPKTKEASPPKKKSKYDPSYEEINVALKVFRQIRKNFPNLYPNRLWSDVQEDWSLIVHKLAKMYDIQQLDDAFTWALTSEDTQALKFWRNNFKGIPGLLKKWKDDTRAIDNLMAHYTTYLELLAKSAERNAPLEDKIRIKIADELNVRDFDSREDYEKQIEIHCEDIADVREWMEDLNGQAIQKNRTPTNFHNTTQVLNVVPFIVWLDSEMYGGIVAGITYDLGRVMLKSYLEYLEAHLDKINLGPWLFDEKSKEFWTFISAVGLKRMLRRFS
jgi:hypothetical protein